MTHPLTMDVSQAAETLKIHPHSLEKLIRRGDIAAGKIGRAYVLMTKDVLAYAEAIIDARKHKEKSPWATT